MSFSDKDFLNVSLACRKATIMAAFPTFGPGDVDWPIGDEPGSSEEGSRLTTAAGSHEDERYAMV